MNGWTLELGYGTLAFIALVAACAALAILRAVYRALRWRWLTRRVHRQVRAYLRTSARRWDEFDAILSGPYEP